VELIKRYEGALKQIKDSEELLSSETDDEMLEMAKEELNSAKKENYCHKICYKNILSNTRQQTQYQTVNKQ